MLDSVKKQIILSGQDTEYTLKISRQVKRLRLAIYPSGELIVTQPKVLSFKIVENFIKSKEIWIIERLKYFENNKSIKKNPLNLLTRRDYLNKREEVRKLVKERLEYFNNFYNFEYTKINIRDQKTRWGSCSTRGCLNFNFKILYLASEIRDYIVVHELCHLKEFNHSVRFWNLVAQTIPDFKNLRKNLKSD